MTHRADMLELAMCVEASRAVVEAAAALLTGLDATFPQFTDGRKPTIAELEAMLASDVGGAVEIKPDGSIHVAPRAEIEALRAALACLGEPK